MFSGLLKKHSKSAIVAASALSGFGLVSASLSHAMNGKLIAHTIIGWVRKFGEKNFYQLRQLVTLYMMPSEEFKCQTPKNL
jgi:hypothetical protein